MRVFQRYVIGAALLAALSAMASPSLALEDDWYGRFQLWNRCQPVFLGVSVNVSDGLGLEESHVATAARSRLRAARMYIDPSDTQSLHPEFSMSIFDVDAVRDNRALAVAIRADFRKILKDHLSSEQHYATTWSRGVVVANTDAPHVVSVVSRIMDTFIDEYLKINGPACHAEDAQRERKFRLGPLVDPEDLTMEGTGRGGVDPCDSSSMP